MCRYLVGYHTAGWSWLVFFSMQAPLVAVETALRHLFKQKSIMVPHAVSVALTIAVLLATADVLFFPPVVDSGLADHVVESIKSNFESLITLHRRTNDADL